MRCLGRTCNTNKIKKIEEESHRNNKKQTCLIDPNDFIIWRLPESKKGTLELEKNREKNPRNFRENEKLKSRNRQPKQREIPMEREYIRRQAPRHSSRKLERRNKQKNPEQARRREEIYTRRGTSWNHRKPPGFKDNSKSTIHFKRSTSLFAAGPHPVYRLQGETCSTPNGLIPDHSSWDHTRSYGYVRRPDTPQRKHPEDQALRDGGDPLTPNRD